MAAASTSNETTTSARPMTTMAVRIAIITAAVGAGISAAAIVEGRQGSLFPNRWASCIGLGISGLDIPAHCFRPKVAQLTVVFDVHWPVQSSVPATIECNTEQTPGGDCYELVEKYSPLIAWGNQYLAPSSSWLVVSTSSLLVRELGLESGLFGMEMLRMLTLGAYDFEPMLGVKFQLDAPAVASGAGFGQQAYDRTAAMAYTVLRNANLPTDIAVGWGQAGCGGQYAWVRQADPELVNRYVGTPFCRMRGCFHAFRGGSIDDPEGLGLGNLADEPIYRNGIYLGTCRNVSVTPDAQLNGYAEILRDECGVPLTDDPETAAILYGFEHQCISDIGHPSAAAWLCLLYAILTAVVGWVASSLILWLLRRHSSSLEDDTYREIRRTFPALLLVAEKEDVDVSVVVKRSASLFMTIEAALDGELSTHFEQPAAGAMGAALHSLVVILIPLPIQASHYFWTIERPAPGWWFSLIQLSCLITWYSVLYVYLVLYYAKRLPFHRPRIILAFRWLTNYFLWMCFEALSVYCIWMLGALAYNPRYVTNCLTTLASAVGFLYTLSSAAGRFSKLQHKQPAHLALYSMGMQQVSDYLQESGAVPAGRDPMEHLIDTQVRPALGPVLAKWGVSWEEVEPSIASFSSIEELGQAIVDPAAFLETLQASGSQGAKRLLHSRLRSLLAPLLAPASQETTLTWEDVRPSVELVDTVDELREAIADPHAFVLKLTAMSASSLGKRWLINQLKAVIEPMLASAGLAWEKAQRVIEKIDSIEEIKEAIADPDGFMQRLKVVLAEEKARVEQTRLPIDSKAAASTGAALVEIEVDTMQTVATVVTKANETIDKLDLTRKELLRIFGVGGVLLLLAIVFTIMGSVLWNRSSGNDGSAAFQTLVMPFSVIVTKLVGDRKISKAEKEILGYAKNGGEAAATQADVGRSAVTRPLPPMGARGVIANMLSA